MVRRMYQLLIIVVVAIFLFSGLSNLGVSSGGSAHPTPLATTDATNITGTQSVLSEGIVTSVVQSSFNYWSPIEDYLVTSMLYLPFATPQFPPMPSMQMVVGRTVTHNSNYTLWSLTIKKGLKWDNGSPLTSKDLWFSLKVYLQLGWLGLMGLNVVDISIVNSTTVSVKTNVSEPQFFDNWVYYTNAFIMPYQTFYPHDENLSATSVNATSFLSFSNFHNIVSDGPFVITNYTPGENPVIFKANPYYYLGKPKMSELSIRFFGSASSYSAAFRSGEISAMWENAAYNTVVKPEFTGLPDASIYNIEPGEFMAAYFNMHTWPFNMTQFRIALAYLTNRSAINGIVNSQVGTMIGYNLLTNSLDKSVGINPSNVPNYSYNIAKARDLLAKIHIDFDNTSGTPNYGYYFYNSSNLPDYGQPVVINITTTQMGYGDLSTAVELSGEWETVGFKVNIVSVASSDIYTIADNAKDWNILVWPDPDGYPPVPEEIVTAITESNNATGYNYPSSFGMANYNYSYVSMLTNKSEEYPINSSQSNQYLREIASYISTVVPVIPLFDGSWWVAVSNEYYWGNLSEHTGLFSTQDLVIPIFYALPLVYPINVSLSSSFPIYYIVAGVVITVAVIGGITAGILAKRRRNKEE